ncbi:MAG: NAD(+)/NADH kinase [Eggerthellaceae bacterium]|jgi:NAD+ kinase
MPRMRLLIIRNKSNEEAVKASDELSDYLTNRGVDHFMCGSLELPRLPQMPLIPEQPALDLKFRGKSINMVVVFGGDGTMLRAARMTGTSGVPILGINYGHLGFLSNPRTDGPIAIVEAALEGRVHREERANLHIDIAVYKEDPAMPSHAGSVLTESYFALNELAITRGPLGRVIQVALSIDGNDYATLRGDGVIISSATGSTAYALSAGGPLVAPSHRGMIIVPLASHSLAARALVTAPGDSITVDFASDDEATRESTLFNDGGMIKYDGTIRRINIRNGDRPTVLLRYDYESFYSSVSKNFMYDPLVTSHSEGK